MHVSDPLFKSTCQDPEDGHGMAESLGLGLFCPFF